MWIPVAVMAAVFGLAAIVYYLRGRAYDIRLHTKPQPTDNQTVNAIQVGALALASEKSHCNYSQAGQLGILTALAVIAALILFFLNV